MNNNKHYENLAKLYLRLKGFLVSNLIIHSEEQGNTKSELDILAIRMPLHNQDYREVNTDDYFECSTSRIEIVIADVKNIKDIKKLKFNKGLRNCNESIEQLVDWIGVKEKPYLINKFNTFLNLHNIEEIEGFAGFDEDLSFGNFTFKFTFFCPSLPQWNGKNFKFIHGEEMINFIWECLNENKRIDKCSRRYNFEMWNELEEYVNFFKKKSEKVTIEEFENFFINIK